MLYISKKPPKIAEWLLYQTLDDFDRDFVIGDFQEFYAEIRNESGAFKASVWYWAQILKSIPHFIYSLFYWRIVMFKNYFKVALRNIKKNKGYSFINITGLATGMACCILILLWVQDELSYDTFHEKAEDLYRITVITETDVVSSSPWALVPALKKDFPEIIKGTWYTPGTLVAKYKDSRYHEKGALVGPDFFEMFSFPFIKGDPKTAFANLTSVVLTEKTASKYFGNDNPIGKIINFENQVDLTVTGVIKNVPANSHLQFDILAHPVIFIGQDRMNTWSMDCPSYVLLQSNADPVEVNRKIYDTINKYDTRTNAKYYISLQPLKKIHLYALEGTNPIIYVYIFSAIAVLVLLIACINFMNLATARSATRAKEIGMRKVIGAVKSDVIRQFFGESIILSFLALLLAIIVVYMFLPAFNSLASKQLTLDFSNNVFLSLGLLVIALITGIISGTYPALYLSAFQPVTIIKSSIVKGGKSHLLRRILIVFQFSAAIILIIASSIIYKQINYIRTKDLGFDRDQIITIRTDSEIRNNYAIIKEELLKNKDILNVTSASSLPLGINNTNPVFWQGRSREQYEMIKFVCVDYDYFETFDMEMSHGRSFSREYPTDMQNYIINETALKLTGYEEPIGKMYSMWTMEGVIVGVVKDFHGTSLHNEITPIVFVLYENLPKLNMFIKINQANIPATIDYLKNILQTFAPNFLFEYRFLDEYFHEQYLREDRLANLLEYFTIFAIFISCLGLMGLASFMAEQRTREIAIRKVLGATHASIIGILSKEFVLLVAVANTIAWPISYYFMNNWIESYTFHTNIGLWLFAFAGVITLFIALFTVGFQAIKASNANPVDALKYE